MAGKQLFQKEQKFIDILDKQGGTPLYELSPEQARQVLLTVQNGKVDMPPVDVRAAEIDVGKGRQLKADIIRPQGIKEKLPVIYYIHGGGWVMGDNVTHRRLTAELAAMVPAAVVFPMYTQAPKGQFPEVTRDLFAGLKYIVEQGEKLQIDTSKLAVAGDSVGGGMAAIMTLMAKQNGFRPKIAGQILLYPETAAGFDTESYQKFADGPWLTKKAMEWFWDQYLPEKTKRLSILAAPLEAEIKELKGLPPALVITDENDVLRDEGEAYARKLDAAGVETTSVRFNGTMHDFMMLNALSDTSAAKTAVALTALKLRQVLYGRLF